MGIARDLGIHEIVVGGVAENHTRGVRIGANSKGRDAGLP